MLGIVTLVFLMLRMLPGDPAVFIAGKARARRHWRACDGILGLDQPLLVQYVTYLAKIVQGNFGQSLLNGTPVLGIVGAALPSRWSSGAGPPPEAS